MSKADLSEREVSAEGAAPDPGRYPNFGGGVVIGLLGIGYRNGVIGKRGVGSDPAERVVENGFV